MVTWPHVTVACAVGVLCGLCYTLSPMIVWFGLAMVGLFAWAGRGLGGRERAWVFGLLGAGVALRVLALVVFFLGTLQVDGSFPVLVPDETHLAYRSRMLRYIALGIPIGQDYVDSSSPYGWSGLHYVHALLQQFVGESPYSIRLFDVSLYLTTCVTLYRMVRPAFGALASLGGLAVVLFQPSLFVWSIAFLKEVPTQFLAVISLVAVVAAMRAPSLRTGAVACMVVGGAALAIETVRPGCGAVIIGGLVLGTAGMALIRWPKLVLVALVVCVFGGGAALRSDGLRQRATGFLATTALYHLGYVQTAGWNYKILDAGFYQRTDAGSPVGVDPNRLTPAATARYLVRAAVSVVAVPLPWHVGSRPALAFLPEQVFWQLLFALAIIGTAAGLRLDATTTCMLAGAIILWAMAIGMTSGN
ncbi:MAG: glycosyltransferase family 39 protein, partial [Acidobacteria bacterium]|nr:glycosyltransferase family 39 protein [Acidobacteriota bacterium]